MTQPFRTELVFQYQQHLYTLDTTVGPVIPFTSLDEANRQLYKQGTGEDHVVITARTIFHPQGGGQPSDVGSITCQSGTSFTVAAARMDAIHSGQVLHFGRFNPSSSDSEKSIFKQGETVRQEINVEKRLHYSRLHTAGHTLGAAVRHLLEKEIEGFDELKASHFPDSAACEFKGLISGSYKPSIQAKVDEYVAASMPVEIDWWDENDFRAQGLERLIPAVKMDEGEKWRVVKIVGAEVYPCGGTHVDTTAECGKVTVRKIARSKGESRVSYAVD